MLNPECLNGLAHDSRFTESVIECNPYLPEDEIKIIQRRVIKDLLSAFQGQAQFLYDHYFGPDSRALLTSEEWQELGVSLP